MAWVFEGFFLKFEFFLWVLRFCWVWVFSKNGPFLSLAWSAFVWYILSSITYQKLRKNYLHKYIGGRRFIDVKNYLNTVILFISGESPNAWKTNKAANRNCNFLTLLKSATSLIIFTYGVQKAVISSPLFIYKYDKNM